MIELHRKICACRGCELSKTRTNVVLGSGNPDSPIVFLGEAPGKDEDLAGESFVGQAGKNLERVIQKLGFTRNDIWITNVVHCRPTVEGRRNRKPNRVEIEACREWTEADLERIPRRLIVTLGNVPLEFLTGSGEISKRHGSPIPGKIPVFPIYHPAYLLYRRDQTEVYFQDVAVLKEYLNQVL